MLAIIVFLALIVVTTATRSEFALYWGQNSLGASGGPQDKWQARLSEYCSDSTTDIFLLAFLDIFFDGQGHPNLDFSNEGGKCTQFPGTSLINCPQIGEDIKKCQASGKKILISLGGASGAYGLTSDTQAESFADTLWDMFLGGSSSMRPFGDAILDGVDWDVEGGAKSGYPAAIRRLREKYSLDTSKAYYISGAPQCPYPDAMLSDALDNSWFDYVFIQFYNNYCSLNGNSFNYDVWDNWAKNKAVNKDVRLFIGLPGSSTAAGSGYIPYDVLKGKVEAVQSNYTSFGGVMMWDASQAYGNMEVSPSVAIAIGNLLHGSAEHADLKTHGKRRLYSHKDY